MKFTQSLKDNILNKIIQLQTHRPRAALKCLLGLGYPAWEVRPALRKLERLDLLTIAKNSDVSLPTIYSTLNGNKENQKAMAALAEAFGIGVLELFPDNGNRRMEA